MIFGEKNITKLLLGVSLGTQGPLPFEKTRSPRVVIPGLRSNLPARWLPFKESPRGAGVGFFAPAAYQPWIQPPYTDVLERSQLLSAWLT